MTRTGSAIQRLAAAILAFGLAAAPALAQTASTLPVTFPEGGPVVTIPLPQWQEANEATLAADVTQTREGATYYIDLTPSGETPTGYSQLFGIAAQSAGPVESEAAKAFAGQFVAACAADNVAYGLITEAAAEHPVAYAACGHRLDVATGTLTDFGQISLAHFRTVNGTLIRVYHQWITAPFTADDDTSWPVSPGDLIARAELVEANLAARPQ